MEVEQRLQSSEAFVGERLDSPVLHELQEVPGRETSTSGKLKTVSSLLCHHHGAELTPLRQKETIKSK